MTQYDTPEAESWSRGFSYEEYVSWCLKIGYTARPLTSGGYRSYCKLMEDEMHRDFTGKEPE